MSAAWFRELGLSDYVAIDTETTGLDPENDALIEIAAVRFVDGQETGRYETLLGLDGNVPDFITQLTGIRTGDLQGKPRFDEIAGDLSDFIGASPLLGQNVEFDLGFLRAHAARLKSSSNREFFEFHNRYVVDSAQLARIFWPEWPSFGLSSLCSRFGVSLARAHRAVDDARATGQVLRAMIEQLPTRVWSEFVVVLDRLIGGTSHRSEGFFRSLLPLSLNSSAPAKTRNNPSADTDLALAQRDIEEYFGTNGMFAATLPGFAVRLPQIEMAQRIEQGLNSDEIVVIEAPTGVGKSLAYLAPCLQWAAGQKDLRRQVIISSHTKALQEQLARKDAGLLSKAVGVPISTAVLKGRNNYLCLRRFNLLLKEARELLSDTDRINLLPMVRWAMLTESGDVNEIGGFRPERHPHLWAHIVSDSVICAGAACSAAKGDFYKEATERAGRATFVFVNHALLMTDPARFQSQSSCERALVIDEAHQLEASVVAAQTMELSASTFRDVLSRIVEERGAKGLLPRVVKQFSNDAEDGWAAVGKVRELYKLVRSSFAALGDALLALAGGQKRSAKLRLQRGMPAMKFVQEHLALLLAEWSGMEEGLLALEKSAAKEIEDAKRKSDLVVELASVTDRVIAVRETLAALLEGDAELAVHWAEFGRGRSGTWCALYRAPIDISSYLAQKFWPQCARAVLTSATLSVDKKFDHFGMITGLAQGERGAVMEAVDSPFDLAQQMQSYVATYLPDPRSADHGNAVADLARELVGTQPRGTLILCTSNESVDQMSEALRPVLRRQERALMVQSGSASVIELVGEFREAKNAVMIGAATLWEGIDVIGDALQILLITKIPFDVPTDPWVEARGAYLEQQGRDAFRDYAVPVATVRLKQGLGRLIRHTEDRGVAIIADPRLFSARYGAIFRRTLQPAMVSCTKQSELMQNVNSFFQRSIR